MAPNRAAADKIIPSKATQQSKRKIQRIKNE